jgi:hypothetical protein
MASVSFASGANIIAGESDTGKSYLLHCMDYIFGADNFRKRIPQAEPYSHLIVEFENREGRFLSLIRNLSGGDLFAYHCRVEDIGANGQKIAHRRYGKSTAPDVTSVLFPFAKIPEATLRSNRDGKTQRLSIRNFIPPILIDEISVIEEQSPVLGRPGYDNTTRERMFAFMLSGKDDRGVASVDRREIAATRLNAQLDIIADLLAPLEKRLLENIDYQNPDTEIERVDAEIATVTASLAHHEDQQEQLIDKQRSAVVDLQRAETQLIAISQLMTRYNLLAERYSSDLERLDFVAEGAYFFDSLQEIRCPLCDQLTTSEHTHLATARSENVYVSARVEAAKILAQRRDLEDAVASLEARREARSSEQTIAQKTITATKARLDEVVQPARQADFQRLQMLLDRRILLETNKNDRDQLGSLIAKRQEVERTAAASRLGKREWEPLPGKALRAFCNEIEAVLKEWQWNGAGQVEFDASVYDIIVDGQSRQSHGKGVRAVLYSAFVIGLLRYCANNLRPHPGFLIIDSPLTSYKKSGTQVKGSDGPIALDVEAAFWDSLTRVPKTIQVIIVENKEPPRHVASAVHYEWFSGNTATPKDRMGFIPAVSRS